MPRLRHRCTFQSLPRHFECSKGRSPVPLVKICFRTPPSSVIFSNADVRSRRRSASSCRRCSLDMASGAGVLSFGQQSSTGSLLRMGKYGCLQQRQPDLQIETQPTAKYSSATPCASCQSPGDKRLEELCWVESQVDWPVARAACVSWACPLPTAFRTGHSYFDQGPCRSLHGGVAGVSRSLHDQQADGSERRPRLASLANCAQVMGRPVLAEVTSASWKLADQQVHAPLFC